jgi:hypothetical protein
MLVHGMIVQGRTHDKHYGAAAVGSPREKELKSCKGLGKRVAYLVTKLQRRKRLGHSTSRDGSIIK